MLQKLWIADRHQGFGRPVHGVAIEFLHQIAQTTPRTAPLQRVAHVVLADHDRRQIGHERLNLAFTQRGQGLGIGHLRIDQGLPDDLQRLLGRGYFGKGRHVALLQVEFVCGNRQGLGQAVVIVQDGRVQEASELLGFGRRLQRIAQQVGIPIETAIAR